MVGVEGAVSRLVEVYTSGSAGAGRLHLCQKDRSQRPAKIKQITTVAAGLGLMTVLDRGGLEGRTGAGGRRLGAAILRRLASSGHSTCSSERVQ